MWRESNRCRARAVALLLSLLAVSSVLLNIAPSARAGGSGSTSGVLPYAAAKLGGSRMAMQMTAATTVGAGGIHRAHP